MIYTSGTTGPPKGAVLSRGAIAANLDALADAWAWTAADTLVHALPLFHVHGLVLGVLGPLRRGGMLRHLGAFSTSALADAIDGGGTLVFGVPTHYHRLADELGANPVAAAAVGARGCSSPAPRRSPPSTTPGCTGSRGWPSGSGTG